MQAEVPNAQYLHDPSGLKGVDTFRTSPLPDRAQPGSLRESAPRSEAAGRSPCQAVLIGRVSLHPRLPASPGPPSEVWDMVLLRGVSLADTPPGAVMTPAGPTER